MKKLLLLFLLSFVYKVSFTQTYVHSGKNNIAAILFDSAGFTLGVKEFNYDSCGITKRQIFKCEFTFKNNDSYPIILKRYGFYTVNTTDPINKVGCTIAHVSAGKNSDTVEANSVKTISIYGETNGIYKPAGTLADSGCIYHWEFSGFTAHKK